jgi:hypothetical protein
MSLSLTVVTMTYVAAMIIVGVVILFAPQGYPEMAERFIKRVPLKWDFKETIGYGDLYKTDDGRIIAKGQITESEEITGIVIKKNAVDNDWDMIVGEVK